MVDGFAQRGIVQNDKFNGEDDDQPWDLGRPCMLEMPSHARAIVLLLPFCQGQDERSCRIREEDRFARENPDTYHCSVWLETLRT